jgi:hypothetical protein
MREEKRINLVSRAQKQRNKMMLQAMRQAQAQDLRPGEHDIFGGAALFAAMVELDESERS